MTNGRKRRLLIVAGEASGDMHAARMIEALGRLRSDVEVAALGGESLRAAGANLLVDLAKEGVTGVSEVLRHLPKLFGAFTTALSAAKRADLVVLVDYPGFNVRLASRLARLQSRPRLLYYIAPQVWAWHKSRAELLSKTVDRVAVVFPFEESLFTNAVFVGHPLLDLPAPAPDPELGKGDVVALFPGSRRNEIRRHLRLLVETGRRLKEKGWRPIVSVRDASMISLFAGTELELYAGCSRTLLASARRAIVKTGTSTMEAALLGVPFVSFYRLSWVSYAIGRMLVDSTRFAMPNILLKDDVVPELIQFDANPDRMIREFDALDEASMKRRFTELRTILGGGGSAERTARLVSEMLG